MNYQIEVQNAPDFPVDSEQLIAAAGHVLEAHESEPGTGLSLVIMDDDGIEALNHHYRGIEAPTDVLSFPAPLPPVKIPGEPPYLGDLVIGYPYAVLQAEQEGHDPVHSLMLLVVHGTLHLLGYDHDTPENRAAMWAAQEAALVALGVSPEIVPALERYSETDEGQDDHVDE
jgi:probable rRNA maturation factor